MSASILKSAWYVAGWADDVGTSPLRRMVAGEAVVLFRTPDGALSGLADACPHRFVPLSGGRIVGESIECPYHGLRFRADGVCVHNPHDTGVIPSGARVRPYAVVERQGFIWIWAGDRDSADMAAIPHFAVLDDPAYATVRGVMDVEANYQLIVDNLVDLSHVDFLHPMLRAAHQEVPNRHEVRRDGRAVLSMLWRDRSMPSGLQRMFWPEGQIGNARAHMRWMPPTALELDTGITGIDQTPEEGVCLPSLHLLTPETDLRTRYYWVHARNRRIDEAELSEQVQRLLDHAFRTEDKPVIEAQQRYLGSVTDVLALKPVVLKPDTAAVLIRRQMQRALAQDVGR